MTLAASGAASVEVVHASGQKSSSSVLHTLQTTVNCIQTNCCNNPNVTVSVHVSAYTVCHGQHNGAADGSVAGGRKLETCLGTVTSIGFHG